MALAAAAAPAALHAQDDNLHQPVVLSLAFEGNRAIDDNILKVSIATSSSTKPFLLGLLGFGEKRYFNETEFQRDVLRIEALYRQSGYVDATVDTLVHRRDNGVHLRFLIYEGEPVRVTALSVTGVKDIVPPARLIRDLPLRVGDPFSRLLLQASTDTILTFLRDRGHPYAEVFRSFEQNREARTAEVAFAVVPGPPATVERVEVVGAGAIPEDVVRRLISVREGRRYRERELYESQLDLYRMGIYNFVDVSLADSMQQRAGDSLVTVHVHVAEGALRRIRFGTGYGTFDCFRTLTSWTGRGVLGGARQLQLSARLSKIGTGMPFNAGLDQSVCFGLRDETDPDRLKLNVNLNASLTEPIFFSRRTSATVSLFAERQSEFKAFLRESFGGELSVTRRTRANVAVTVTYSLARVKTVAEPATLCAFFAVCLQTDTVFSRGRLRSTVALGIVRDRTNAVLDPTRGSVFSSEMRYGSTLIAADELSQFARTVLEYASYHRVGRRSVLAWRVRVGGVFAPETVDEVGRPRRFVPPEERFFAGGANSVRGFGQNELGPVVRVLDTLGVKPDTVRFQEVVTGSDSTLPGSLRTAPVGGSQLILANAEFRFPLPGFGGRLSGAMFVDAGRLIERDDQLLDLDRFRVTPGIGIRLMSPLGPIRLDIAYDASNPLQGPLYLEDEGNRVLTLLDSRFAPKRPGFLGRLQVHFSVGQAF